MTYQQAIAFWFGRVNYEQRSPRPSDLKLDRMRALLELLGNPHDQLRIVHIAGSKGKGSTSAMLASIFRQAGYRTGLFTSPHLVRVEERIQVDDSTISAEELAGLMTEVAGAVRLLDARKNAGSLTFFEIATALGFLHFSRRRVDVAVIEVGLGGRFDSTNVCRPLVSLITSISFDHTQQLGNTLAKIAVEKAGIVKPGRPTISGARTAEAREVIEAICRQRNSPLLELDVDFHYSYQAGQVGDTGDFPSRVEVTTPKRHWPAMEIGLLGEHQAANAALALAAVEQLSAMGLHLEDQAVAEGLARVRWPARLEVLGRRPLVLLDCAHNLASAQALVDTLHTSFSSEARNQESGVRGQGSEVRSQRSEVRGQRSEAGTNTGQRFLIFAGNRDKDLAGMLRLLAPHFNHVFLTRFTNNPRCVPPQDLANFLPPILPRTVCARAEVAWQKAHAAANPQDLICVTGSVFLAGELRPILLRGLTRPTGRESEEADAQQVMTAG